MLTPRPRLLLLAVLSVGATAASAHGQSLRQRIDFDLKAAWQREKLTPAPRADDATFLRRVYIDLVGTIPTYDEAKQFLDDKGATKRAKRIDKLLADPRFGVQQAQVWDQVFFGRNPPNGDATRKRDGFRKWLEDEWNKNVPYDQWVRKLLSAEEGDTGLFYVQY
jgi:hypothetical protein